jgi:BRCA1-associated protein
MCLICGYIGCGRYTEAHANAHFKETCHTYAMDLDSQRVWDYAGDGWIHRLIQNRTDGKLVAVDEPNAVLRESTERLDGEEHMDRQMHETMMQSKKESIDFEYTYLLTSQLEQQRRYFEDRQARLETEMRELNHELEKEVY